MLTVFRNFADVILLSAFLALSKLKSTHTDPSYSDKETWGWMTEGRKDSPSWDVQT